ncbi:hypothetical protein [Variovorax paradoxus]|uniref:hypothetical protein n=1 Tax=Variovorax paradoxus TaxID=34073 RepID=UPI003D6619D8
MKQLRSLKPMLLVVAAAVAGCSFPLVAQAPDASAPAAKAMSCAERSADARPPTHPIVELVRCVAATDDLYDHEHLIDETLRIQSGRRYRESKNIWGISVVIDGGRHQTNEIRHLPEGIIELSYSRIDLDLGLGAGEKGRKFRKKRYLAFDTSSEKICIRPEDIFSVFGRQSSFAPTPIMLFALAIVPGTTPSAPSIPRISYTASNFFAGDGSGSIDFEFSDKGCVSLIAIWRDGGVRQVR